MSSPTDTQPEGPVERRVRYERVLAAIEAFIASDGYAWWKTSRQNDISVTEGAIIAMDPIERKDEIEGFKLRGDLRTTQDFLTIFEDTASSLRKQIDELVESEKQTGPANTTNETEETIQDLL